MQCFRRPALTAVRPLAFAITMCLASRVLALDTVTLIDGTEKRGNVKSETPTELVLTSGAGSVKREEKLPTNEVRHVSYDGEVPQLKLARGSEDQGRLDKALEGYTAALAAVPGDKPMLKTELEFLIGRVLASQAKTDNAKVADAEAKLRAFKAAHPNSYRYYPTIKLLAELSVAAGDANKAATDLALLEQAPFQDYKMSAKIARGRILLSQNKVAEAQAEFEAVTKIAPPKDDNAAMSRRYEAIVGVGSCLSRLGKPDEATKQFEQVIREAPANASAVMAEAYLRKGDSLLAAGRKKDALLAYLHVDVLFSSASDFHAEALFRLAELWTEVGEPGRAADARAMLGSAYANNKWAKKLTGG